MKTILSVSAAILTMVGMFVAGETARGQSHEHGDEFEHFDELAVRLQGQVSQLRREFRANYRHTSQYRHLSRDTAKMGSLAAHVHDVVHEGDVDHLHEELHSFDEALEHVTELVADIEHHAEHDHGDGGHTHGDPRRVRRMLSAIEGTLHHLLEEVEEMPRGHAHADEVHEEEHGHEHEVQRGRAPTVLRRDSNREPGVTIGGRRFQIRIGD